MTSCPTCGQTREHRSKVSHDHFFASVQNAYDNLPEGMEDDFKSAEHLRKWALIQAGFCDVRNLFLEHDKDGRAVARALRSMDTYAIVTVHDGGHIAIHTAKSQSLRAMGKVEFQKSKDAVFDVLAKLIGADVADLKKAQAA